MEIAVRREHLLLMVIQFAATNAYSQSDPELLERVRANAAEVYLDQASFTLPDYFHSSGLAPSDKKKLIEQWADASGHCHAEALAAYVDASRISLSEIVSDDGTYSFGKTVPADWERHLTTCLAKAWEGIGATLPE